LSRVPTYLVCFIVALVLLSGCNAGQPAPQTPQAAAVQLAFDTTLPKGKLVDTVPCRQQSAQTYALYLPKNYTVAKKFPIVYFFDAHASGALPLRKYKSLAEKYGFVFVGSNVSKNGIPWEVNNESIKILMDDVKNRINIDEKRIYTSGFSGGSRVASSIAIFNGGVAGVIGCALGFPETDNVFQNKFDYFGLAGEYDFNMSDMEILDDALQQNGFNHQLLTFAGKHEWAPPSEFETALLWMQVNAIKKNLTPKDDSIVAWLREDYKNRIAAASKAKDFFKLKGLLSGAVSVLTGVAYVSGFSNQVTTLSATPEYKSALKLHTDIQQEELSIKQDLAPQFTQKDINWWTKEINTLNRKSLAGDKKAKMNRRLLNFVGLIAYMNISHSISTGDFKNAKTYLKIFKMADPKNPDCSFLTALYYSKTGDNAQAMTALSEAAALGFNDVVQVAENPVFKDLANSAAFKAVVEAIKANSGN
jgi:dienelactone hydrolase